MSNDYTEMPYCLVFEREADAVDVAEEYADRNNLYPVNGGLVDRYYERQLPILKAPLIGSYSRLNEVIIPNRSVLSETSANDLSKVADEVLSE